MPQHYCTIYEMFQENHKYGTGKRLDEETDAFYGYKMEQDETAPVFLTYDELQTVMNKEFTIPRLALVRDIFHFRLFHRSGICRCVHAQKKEDMVQDNNGDWWIRKGRIKLMHRRKSIFNL